MTIAGVTMDHQAKLAMLTVALAVEECISRKLTPAEMDMVILAVVGRLGTRKGTVH